jgi:hypothetical protein
MEVFLSYSGRDSFEASLLQFALEQMLGDLGVVIWTYERDQNRDERNIGQSLKSRVQKASAAIFLASPSTFASGAAQWMELAYADAFDVPIFVLLHRFTFADLKSKEEGVPPLLLEGQCNPAAQWKDVATALRARLQLKRSDSTSVGGPT